MPSVKASSYWLYGGFARRGALARALEIPAHFPVPQPAGLVSRKYGIMIRTTIITDRCVVSVLETVEKKQPRWEWIVQEAAEQSHIRTLTFVSGCQRTIRIEFNKNICDLSIHQIPGYPADPDCSSVPRCSRVARMMDVM